MSDSFTARSQAFLCEAKRCGTNSTLISLSILGFLSLSSFFSTLAAALGNYKTYPAIQIEQAGKLTFSVASLHPEGLPALHHLIVGCRVANGVRFSWVIAVPVHRQYKDRPQGISS